MMMHYNELASVPSGSPVSHADPLRLAVAAYLARFKGISRDHTHSDLRCYLTWCAERSLDPLAARRPHLELYLRWMQEIRRFKPSTVSRRFSVTAGFYRTCVINGVLDHSPAGHVRRPAVPAESPTPGVHPPAVRGPAHSRPRIRQPQRLRPGGHAGPPGPCGSSRPPAQISVISAKSTATGCCASAAKAARWSWSRCRQRSGGLSTAPSAPGRPARSCSTTAERAWIVMQAPGGSAGSRRTRVRGSPRPHPHMLRHVRHDHA